MNEVDWNAVAVSLINAVAKAANVEYAEASEVAGTVLRNISEAIVATHAVDPLQTSLPIAMTGDQVMSPTPTPVVTTDSGTVVDPPADPPTDPPADPVSTNVLN